MVSRGLGVDVDGNLVVSASFGVDSHGPKFWENFMVAECVFKCFLNGSF